MDFFPDLLERFSGNAFLESVCKKYHFGISQEMELQAVAGEMLPLMRREAFWESREAGSFYGKQEEITGAGYEDVIMSLGSSLDSLQESYHERGLLSESYMLEALASELLLMGYGAYNSYVNERRDRHVARYHFPGGEEGFPLEMMPELLKGFQHGLTCNAAFCIIPKKSVVFVAELTKDMQIQCESVCTGCQNIHCPNRIKADPVKERMMARMADLPLDYGYSRIFGRLK